MRAVVTLSFATLVFVALPVIGQTEETPPLTYDSFTPTEECAMCHQDIARQHEQAMMSQSFTHRWDEIEYYELALPHARKEPKVAGIETGCNGCHAPLAVLVGDIPPKRPVREHPRPTRASPATCAIRSRDLKGDVPFNFNWVVSVGEIEVRTARRRREHGTRDRRRNAVLRDGRVLWYLPQREGPVGHCGSRRPTSSGRRRRTPPRASSARTVTCLKLPPRADGRRRRRDHGRTCAPICSTAPIPTASSFGVIEVRIHPRRVEIPVGEDGPC